MNSSVLSLPLTKISELIQKKVISPVDLCKLCLNRIKRIKILNAYITVAEQTALEQAKVAEKKISEGKLPGILGGIPIAIKDNFSTAYIRTTCASKMLSNYIPPYNATVVQKLLNGDSIIVGKTNLDEFAMGSATIDSFYGPTKNPWRSGLRYKLQEHLRKASNGKTKEEQRVFKDSGLEKEDFFICGGSSGGSAVAVASGTCFGAIASDTGGSTRHPSSFCGVIGLKPTYGLVSRHGLIPLCNSLDVPGIITRSVDDASVLLNYLAGPDPLDSTTVQKPFLSFCLPDEPCIKSVHFGIPKEFDFNLSSEVKRTWKMVADKLDELGARVSYVSLPHAKYSIECYTVLACCDIASNFARYDGIRYGHRSAEEMTTEHHYAVTRREGFGEVVRERILAGNYFLLKKNYENYFLKAAKVRRLIHNDFISVFDSGVDILLTPVTLTEAVPYTKWILVDRSDKTEDVCTQPVNLAGLPAVSIPCLLSDNGLPVSLQLIGKAFNEKLLLSAAKCIEQHMEFPHLSLSDDLE